MNKHIEMECPQNIVVPGLSSKSFRIQFHHAAKTIDEEMVVMKEITDKCTTVFGDEFVIKIISAISPTFDTSSTTNNLNNNDYVKQACTMVITMPKYYWLVDMARCVSVFQQYVDKYVYPGAEVYIHNSNTPLSLKAGNKGIYHMFYENGKFTKKQLVRVVQELNENGVKREFLKTINI